MEKAPQWILWFIVFNHLFLLANAMQNGMKLTTRDLHPDFISIDCGASSEYTDPQTGILYQTDTDFVETGKSFMLANENRFEIDAPAFGRQLQTLRSFPDGERNCYTLKLKQGKNQKYLIRAFFAYGNYDAKNQTTTFDLFLNVDFWETMDLDPTDHYSFSEIIHTPTTDTILVCLVNTDRGTPFISTLELRPLHNSIYLTPSPSQSLLVIHTSIDVGSTDFIPDSFTRFEDDIYDRVWRADDVFDDEDKDLEKFNSSEHIDVRSIDDSYKLPMHVLMSAIKSSNLSSAITLDYDSLWENPPDKSYRYYVYFHFVEIEKLPAGQKRVIDVSFNGPITLEYLEPVTVATLADQYGLYFSINAAPGSDAPPILNAIEIYKFISPLTPPTDQTDADTIMGIKTTYKINKVSWQGDPCAPEKLAWEGLKCRYGINNNNARIISLNLSSSKLTGVIAPSLASLEKLESLDLSNNELTGPLPEFLATLPNLKFINVTGNKLTGTIPKALRGKANLELSVDNNPGFCPASSCKEVKEHNKFVIPLAASLSTLAIVTVLIVSLVIWRFKMKAVLSPEPRKKKDVVKPKNQTFSYLEVLSITKDFETMIGEGGFGKVYLGTLEDDTQVAVKLLSPSSRQGHKEFLSEAQLLTIHHRNLVSLVGFCDENEVKALIYKYMDLGDLGRLLSEKNQNVLKWSERLQVAIDAAKGLEYLHNGCKTPIIHRDLKPSNILLNKFKIAKIADFGLSKAFTNEIDSHILTQPAGTPGYIDPEFQRSGKLDKKSDMYSFGMILLQLITGHPPIRRQLESICFIIDWIRPKIECRDIQSIVDQRLKGEFQVSSAWKAVETAISCTEPHSSQRPEISYVLNELQECLAKEIGHSDSNGIPSHPINYDSGQLDSITTLSAR